MQKSIHTDEQKHFQEMLKAIRKEANLTQVELAKRLNTHHSRISDYENGERRLDLVQLKHYCNALGVTLTEFVERFENQVT